MKICICPHCSSTFRMISQKVQISSIPVFTNWYFYVRNDNCEVTEVLVAFAKLLKASISFVMSVRKSVVCLSVCLSVCPSACNNSNLTKRIFMKFNI